MELWKYVGMEVREKSKGFLRVSYKKHEKTRI